MKSGAPFLAPDRTIPLLAAATSLVAFWQFGEGTVGTHVPLLFCFIAVSAILLTSAHTASLSRARLFISEIFPLTVGAYLFCREWSARAPIVPDGVAVTLRYLENFKRGCILCFDIADGPLLGIANVVFTAIVAVFSIPRQISPQTALLLVETLTLAACVFLTIRVLELFSLPSPLIYLYSVAGILSARLLLISAVEGSEAPFHLAVALFTLWALLCNRRALFASGVCACAIVKLDLIPLALVWTGYYLYANRTSLAARKERVATIRTFLLFTILPLGIFWGALVLFFGTPFPLSFVVKYFYQDRPSLFQFRSLRSFLDFSGRGSLLSIFIVIFCSSFGRIIRKEPLFSHSAPFAGAVSLVMGHLLFNAREQLDWYYALPQYLLIIQAIILLDSEIRWLTTSSIRLLIAFLLLSGFSLEASRWSEWELMQAFGWTSVVEGERMAAGSYVSSHAFSGDQLLTGFANVAQTSKIRVHDLSGRNSTTIFENGLVDNSCKSVLAVNPEWLVATEVPCDSSQDKIAYRLKARYFEGTLPRYGGTWSLNVFEARECGPGERFKRVAREDVETEGVASSTQALVVVGRSIQIKNIELQKLSALSFGLERRSLPGSVALSLLDSSARVVHEEIFEIPPVTRTNNTRQVIPVMRQFATPLDIAMIRFEALPRSGFISEDFPAIIDPIGLVDPMLSFCSTCEAVAGDLHVLPGWLARLLFNSSANSSPVSFGRTP